MCCASIACALLSTFVSDSSLKKILSLVMGAFVVCSLLAPVRNAAEEIASHSFEEYEYSYSSTADEAANAAVLATTKKNLELALEDLLAQNGITAEGSEIIIAVSGNNRIIISSVSIYISEEYLGRQGFISTLVTQNFGIEPFISTEKS